MTMLLFGIILSLLFVSPISSYSFNVAEVTVISSPYIVNRYFGYSLLLQKGKVSILTVGAPKGRFIKKEYHGGEVFQCLLNSTKPSCVSAFYNYGDNLYNSPNGDFLGGTVNGDDHSNGSVIACSYRTPFKVNTDENQFYLYGKCVVKRNQNATIFTISPLNMAGVAPKRYNPVTEKMYYAYGYAVFGFDISLYNGVNLLCGAPGMNDMIGANLLLNTSISAHGRKQEVAVLPKGVLELRKRHSYFGYSVHAANNTLKLENWFITGAPRDNGLKGFALLYKYVKIKKNPQIMIPIQKFLGNEFGSYFGASTLTIDMTGDNALDVFVGAPMSTGKSYDEGCVYFYKYSEHKHILKSILTGSGKTGARFGLSVASLGDFDLDGFNDIAISAPYEDDCQGAVYIYRGDKNGPEDQFSQRLSPATFNSPGFAKGFGLGISRGSDIDHNGHNDIAIGAYKSDQVFIISGLGIVDIKATITPNIQAIQRSTLEFSFELCLNYSKRSAFLDLPHIDFEVNISLDYRSKSEDIEDYVSIHLGQNKCSAYNISIQPIGQDISHFIIDTKLEVKAGKNVKVLGDDALTTTIPYAIGCSKDNICHTGLIINAIAKRATVILGKDKQIDLKVTVSNDKDPATECKLLIQAPSSLKLRNINCKQVDTNYACTFSDLLARNETKTEIYSFNINGDIDPNLAELQLNISVTSYGVNEKSHDKDMVKIPIIKDFKLYIIGNSIPETMEVQPSERTKETEIVHRFTIGKTGPSPAIFNVTLLIPKVYHNNETIFRLLKVSGNDRIICVPVNDHTGIVQDQILDQIETKLIQLKPSILLYCDNLTECEGYTCKGLLDNSNQKAVLEIRMMIISKLIVKKFSSELKESNLIAYLPIAILHTTHYTNVRFTEIAKFVIFVQGRIHVPLWIFTLGSFVGMVLLILLILALFKCSFFQREYQNLIVDQLIKDAILEEENRCFEEYDDASPVQLRTSQAEKNDFV